MGYWGEFRPARRSLRIFISYEEKLNKLELFSLEKKKVKGNHLTVYKYLKEVCTEGGAVILSVGHRDRTRGNGHILRHRSFF